MSHENQLSNRLTIANYFARTHLANGISLGAQEQQILRHTGLTAAQLAHPKARILASQLASIVSNCWRYSGDELLGFTEHKLKAGMFELLAEHLITCKTLEEVLNYIVKFYCLSGDQLTVKMHRIDSQLVFSLSPNFKLNRHQPVTKTLLIELLLLICHRFCSWLLGQVIPLTKVCLKYPRPQHHQEYRLMFPAYCEFNSQYNALVFDTKYLDLPVIRNTNELASYLQQIPLPWFKKQSFYGAWTAQVMALLEKDISIEEAADKLNMTSRTLRRKLTKEGSSFQQLKDNARRDQAINLFEQRKLTIAEIGLKIGFTEAATFSRAFKQWTGVSPSSYRRYK
tara:strand:- start:241 stop:1260 length:1020 start_codon:yes stop_codon:yes gene_type:complete